MCICTDKAFTEYATNNNNKKCNFVAESAWCCLGGVIPVVSMYFSALPRKVYLEYNFAFPIQIEEINGNSVSGIHFGIHSMNNTSIWKCLQTHWHRQGPRKGCPPTRIKPSTTTNSQKTLPASTSLVSITTASLQACARGEDAIPQNGICAVLSNTTKARG